MNHPTSKRRGHGEDSIYWDESKKRYVGAVSLGHQPDGTRIRKKVTGRTKAEVRDNLRQLHQEVDSGLRPGQRYPVSDALRGLAGSWGRLALVANRDLVPGARS